MNRKILALIIVILIFLLGFVLLRGSAGNPISRVFQTDFAQDNMGGEMESEPYSLSIESLRLGDYPGSDLVIEQTLTPGSNYQRYIVSYRSEGLKIYALLTIPNGKKPKNGWSVIIFTHGYIPPTQYRTTERYIAYTDGFSRNGYIVFRP